MATSRRTIVIAVVIAALALTACNPEEARLETLRTDPMADVHLPDAVDVKVAETGGNLRFGVTSSAFIRHGFTMPPGGVPDAIEDLAEQARAAGWDLHDPASGYGGSKIVGGLSSSIGIGGLPDSNDAWVEISTNDS